MNIDNINSLIISVAFLIKDCSDSDDLILLSLFSDFLIKKRKMLLLKERYIV